MTFETFDQHLRHWLQYWQLRTWINDNLCYLTINCDTGQHSQFLRCLSKNSNSLQFYHENKTNLFLGFIVWKGFLCWSIIVSAQHLQRRRVSVVERKYLRHSNPNSCFPPGQEFTLFQVSEKEIYITAKLSLNRNNSNVMCQHNYLPALIQSKQEATDIFSVFVKKTDNFIALIEF